MERCTLEGEQRTTVIQLDEDHYEPHGLTVFGDRLYWADHADGGVIHHCHKLNGGPVDRIPGELGAHPVAIKSVHHTRQPPEG